MNNSSIFNNKTNFNNNIINKYIHNIDININFVT